MNGNNTNGYPFEHALVVGGSIGGMLAAIVLAKFFKTVTIIERDTINEVSSGRARKGVPQGANGHSLTIKGVNILSEFFPNLFDQLKERGVEKIDILKNTHFYLGDWMPIVDSGLLGCYVTRPYLEFCIRTLLKQQANIQFRYDTTVKDILFNKDKKKVVGIRIMDANDKKEIDLYADFVIDASGRHTLFPRTLVKQCNLGIEKTQIKLEVFYTSYIFLRPEQQQIGFKSILVGTGYKHGTRYGALWEIERNEEGQRRWQVNLIGHSVHPDNAVEEFKGFAKTLLQTDIYEAIQEAEPEANGSGFFKFTGSSRTHYEKAPSLPARFIAIGDAFCILNPVYGQGMSACALEAKVLEQCLENFDSLEDVQHHYFKKSAHLLNTPWNLSNFHDFVYPGTEGELPRFFHQINKYQEYVLKAAVHNPKIWVKHYKVLNLLLPPSCLFTPKMILKVLTVYIKEKFAKLSTRHSIPFEDIKNQRISARLVKVDLLKQISSDEFVSLCNTAEIKKYHALQLIIKEGDIGSHFYIIDKGSASVSTLNNNNEEIVLARLERGDYFGEQSLLEEGGRCNSNVIAITDMVIIAIPRQKIISIFLNNQLKSTLENRKKMQLLHKILKKNPSMETITTQLASKPIVEFLQGETIFRKGDIADNAYLLISGNVSIHLEEKNVPTESIKLEAGRLFGELSILHNKLRAGTAMADSPVKTIAIPAGFFKELYEKDTQLQILANAMERSYHLPQRGKMIIQTGTAFGLDAVQTIFKLHDGREITADMMLAQSVFIMTSSEKTITRTLQFKESEATYREISLNNDIIVRINNYGHWQELGLACGMVLDKIKISSWQILLFEKTGSLGAQISESNDTLICYCTQQTYGQILNAISFNATDLDTLIQNTGVATVCGSCKPRIMELMGKSWWDPVYISNIKVLADDVHCYQLKSYNESLSTYQPGQHLVIQAFINKKWVNRSYTLTSIDINNYYELTIKREPEGYFSNWLFENETNNPLIRVSAPQGDFILDTTHCPIVFFAGGIGITPALSFARFLKLHQLKRRLHIEYLVHSEEQLLNIEELTEIANSCSNFTFYPWVSTKRGRITVSDIEEIRLKFPDAEFYICGSEPFCKSLNSLCSSLNIETHMEEFVNAAVLL